MKFRRLNANEIDARVSTVKENGVSLLLYKDARVDQNILDETVGAENWERKHELIGNNLYCTVSIWDESKKAWISKQDVGVESYTEKEKGQASDSFKRACFNWGIGRELYTAPFIWINSGDVKITGSNGKFTTYDRFEVKSIGYDDLGNINSLQIIHAKTRKVVFSMNANDECKHDAIISKKEQEVLKNLCIKKGLDVATTFPQGLELTSTQYADALKQLKKLKDKKADTENLINENEALNG